MVVSSRTTKVPATIGECSGIRALVEDRDISAVVNERIQQADQPHGSRSVASASARCYKLGPCVCSPPSERLIQDDKKPFFVSLCKFFPSVESKILALDFSSLVSWKNWCKNGSPIVGWHKPDETYCLWVEKLEKRLGQKWRDLRIYEAIILSTRRISFDGPLMCALMCFWDKSCNAFLLPEGPMGITMEDVVAITSCSPVGVELSTLETDPSDAKNTYRWTDVTGYTNFLKEAMAIKHPEQEEMAFYLYWVCKFLVCTRSAKILKGFQCVAETIFHAKGPIALAPVLLGLAYNCIGNTLRSNFSENVSGPLWLVLLWAQAYFVPVAARVADVDYPHPTQQHFRGIHSYGDQIIFSQVQFKRTFEECFHYLADSRRIRNGEEWNPFVKRKFGSDWFRSFTLDMENTRDANDAWKAILIARDLPVYLGATLVFLEPYSPNQFARQLGHLQSLPVPFYQTINQPWHSRQNVSASVVKNAEYSYSTRKSAILQIQQSHGFPYSDHNFVSWWSWYWYNVSLDISKAREHFVSKFETGLCKRVAVKHKAPAPKRRRVSVVLEESTPSSSPASSSSPPSSSEMINESDDDEFSNSNTSATSQQRHDSGINVKEHRKKLENYMDMSIESIYETKQLSDMERAVDILYCEAEDALETPILGDLKKQLTGLKDKIPSLASSIKSAQAERESLRMQNADLAQKLKQERQALQADESELSELTTEEARLNAEMQELVAKKEAVLAKKASAAKNVERRKLKVEEVKNMDAKMKKAEYNCFQWQNEMNRLNATVNTTLMDAKRVLFKRNA